MEEADTLEKLSKRDRYRLRWSLGGAVLCMLGLIVYIVFFYDIGPPDDTWLLPKPFPPSSGPGSIPEFVRDTRSLLEASNDERGHLKAEDLRVSGSDLTKVREYLARHREALKRWQTFADTSHGPLLFPGGDKGLDLGVDYSYLSLLQKGANLAALKARLLARDGKLRESLEQSLRVMQLGQQLCQGTGGKVQWLVGVTLQVIANSSLEYAARQQAVETPELDLMEKALPGLELPASTYKFAMQGDYLAFKNTISKSKSKTSMMSSLPPGIIAFPWWAVFSFKRNMTLGTLLELEHSISEACNADWCKTFAAAKELSAKLESRKDHLFLRLMNANIGGNMLVDMDLVSEDLIIEKGVRMAAYHRQTQIMIALRRYEMEHSSLPEKLEMLCPKFLSTVPLDPYDNQPMRWNLAAKAVYALGKDLTDDGGNISRPFNKEDKDIGMFYWWAKPATSP